MRDEMIYQTLKIIVLLFLFSSCTIIGRKEDDDGGGITPGKPIYPQTYAEPSVSPDGSKLLFVRNKVTQINKAGFFTIDPDSSGIWMADSDGSNMKLLIKSQNVGTPSFSPDMEWILFEGGAQIYKVPFARDSVNMDSLVQLTSKGRNFFPDWSPDGKWIAYSSTIGDRAGIWISPTNGLMTTEYFAFGAEPDWLSNEEILFGNQGLWTKKIDHSAEKQLFYEPDKLIRGIKSNKKETKISFSSEESIDKEILQIFIIDFDGSNLDLLSNDGGVDPTWTQNDKIIYVRFNPHYFSENNGTIWIMNADGSNKYQLTKNFGLLMKK